MSDCPCSGDVYLFLTTELASALDTILANVEYIYSYGLDALGLSHENAHVDNMTYDSQGRRTGARVRTYTDAASVGTSSNVLATYVVTASYDSQGRLSTYKVVKQ